MTLAFSAIRMPSLLSLASLVLLLPFQASAAELPIPLPKPQLLAAAVVPVQTAIEPVVLTPMVQIAQAPAPVAAAPSVEWPLKRLYCVEYARLRSGLAIFGDAKYWWSRAANLYAQAANPVVDAVMVFSGSKRIRHGHVAVVASIVSPREIIVDHANWQNRGEIDRNMPVLDVSAANDWSQVRVWDVKTSQFGTHVYRISGFIAHSLTALASAGS